MPLKIRGRAYQKSRSLILNNLAKYLCGTSVRRILIRIREKFMSNIARSFLLSLLAFVFFLLLSQLIPILAEVTRKQSFSQGKEIDKIIKGFLAIDSIKNTTEWLRWFLNVKVLIPCRNSLLWIPTPAFILIIMGLGW